MKTETRDLILLLALCSQVAILILAIVTTRLFGYTPAVPIMGIVSLFLVAATVLVHRW
jgi:hypothetical protein